MGKKQYLFHQIKIRCKIHVHKGVIITNETDWLKSGVVGGGYNCKTYIGIKNALWSTNTSLWKFIHSLLPHPPPPSIYHPGPPKMSSIIKEFPVVFVFKVDGKVRSGYLSGVPGDSGGGISLVCPWNISTRKLIKS